jgi:hypothetical protein
VVSEVRSAELTAEAADAARSSVRHHAHADERGMRFQSPEGTTDILRGLGFNRPYGTSVFDRWKSPSVETLGYCHESRRDRGDRGGGMVSAGCSAELTAEAADAAMSSVRRHAHAEEGMARDAERVARSPAADLRVAAKRVMAGGMFSAVRSAEHRQSLTIPPAPSPRREQRARADLKSPERRGLSVRSTGQGRGGMNDRLTVHASAITLLMARRRGLNAIC